MDGFEQRITTLLHDAVPEPHGAVSVREVERLGRRRRAVAIATPIVAVVAVVLAVVVTITVARRDDKPVPPARPKSSTLSMYGVTVTYPAGWHRGRLVHTGTTASAADAPTAFVTSAAVSRVCQPVYPSGQFCQNKPVRLAASDVYVGYNAFTPLPPGVGDPALDRRIAGRPASVTDDADVATECPKQTASTTDVVIKIGPQRYLSIMGCLGSSPAATKVFRALLASARWTG